MEQQSIGELRDWLHSHKDELVTRVPKLRDLKGATGPNSTFPVNQQQLIELWKEVSNSLKDLKAPHEIEAEARALLAQAQSDAGGDAPFPKPDSKTHMKVKALAGHGGGTATPLFWRGCAFGALAAVSSGFGAGAAVIACLAVGIFAD